MVIVRHSSLLSRHGDSKTFVVVESSGYMNGWVENIELPQVFLSCTFISVCDVFEI